MEEKDKNKTVIGRLLEEDEETEDKTKIYEGERKQTRIQQIEEEIERERFERFKRAEKARRIRRNRAIIEKIKQMDEGRAPRTIDAYVKNPKVYIKALEAIDFTIQRSGGKQRGKGKHTFLIHDDYPDLYTTVSGNFQGNVRNEIKSELKGFIKDINAYDALPKNKRNREKRSKKGQEILALDIGGKDMNKNESNTVNEVNEEFIAGIKKEFYEKYDGNYGSDVTKELKKLFSGNLTKDIKYHGKHRGYNMFTYLTETNVLMAVCPVFRLDMSENDIGKKDIDLLVEELRGLINDFISFGRKNGGFYRSYFLGKTIRV